MWIAVFFKKWGRRRGRDGGLEEIEGEISWEGGRKEGQMEEDKI